MAVDLRNHGESSWVPPVSFGLYEAADVRAAAAAVGAQAVPIFFSRKAYLVAEQRFAREAATLGHRALSWSATPFAALAHPAISPSFRAFFFHAGDLSSGGFPEPGIQ